MQIQMNMAQEPIAPVLDLSLAAEEERSRRLLADEIAAACTRAGFFLIKNHGVPDRVIRDMYQHSVAFFEGPEDRKEGVAAEPADPLGRGFKRRTFDPILLETFAIHRPDERLVAPAKVRDELGSSNRWPNDTPLRAAYTAYYCEMERLSGVLLEVLAMSLGLPPDVFGNLSTNHMSTLTANYYPPMESAAEPGLLRQGVHRDWGDLTILYQDGGPGGLEVQDRDGSWHHIPCVPGTFVVNVGDIMSIWTAGKYRSAVHRVACPAPERIHERRVSVAFFHQPDFAAPLAPVKGLPTGARASGAGATAGSYLLSSWLRSHPEVHDKMAFSRQADV